MKHATPSRFSVQGLHEAHGGGSGIEGSEHGFGLRALQCDQGSIDPFNDQRGAQGDQPRKVGITIASVDHHAHFIAKIDQHEIVFDAARVIEQKRIFLQPDRPAVKVHWQCRLECVLQRGLRSVACPNA